jgi:Tfp pilus assembly protein PilX
MNARAGSREQRGAITIFVCMMMLIFITLMVVTAFSLSSVNLQSVGNAQVREEAIAAAQSVIEEVVASPFTDNPVSAVKSAYPVDINGDGVFDYFIDLPEPACLRFTRANTSVASSVTLPGMTAVDAWNTIWELDATATDATTGARVRVRQGVRKLLSDTEKNLVCS